MLEHDGADLAPADIPFESPVAAGSRVADQRVDMGFFAGTILGRLVLSAVIGFLVFLLVVWNLPRGSHIRAELRGMEGVKYPVYGVAIDQSWAVFSPNPTDISIRVEADIFLTDGQVVRHTFPDGDWHIGGLSEYRWRKWERRVRLDENSRLWLPTAEWLAGKYDDVSRVVLIREWSDTPEPGSGIPRVWESFEFYTLEVTG